jgi:hypothetical protein
MKNTLYRIMPAIAGTPRRAAVSAALIASIAAGPIAGLAAPAHAATPTATQTVAGSQAKPAAGSKPAAVPAQELMPTGTPTDQSSIDLTPEQTANAKAIVDTAKQMKLPPRAAVIAVATSMQETQLHNYGSLGSANDHDSLGLFQQRPSSGWGSAQQVTDPHHATAAFLKSLVQVPGWQSMPLTDAAQTVQVSAFGDRYAQWEQQAADLVQADYAH